MNHKVLSVVLAVPLLMFAINTTPTFAERPSDEELQKIKEEKKKQREEYNEEKEKKLQELKDQREKEYQEKQQLKKEMILQEQEAKEELQKPPVKIDSDDDSAPLTTEMKKQKLEQLKAKYPESDDNAKIHKQMINGIIVSLEEVSDSEEELGNEDVSQEIDEVIEESEETSDSTEDAIESVEKRNKFKTALVGTDYKNLGQLRSNLVKNENQIRKLTRTAANIEDPTNQQMLQEQIVLLVAERERMKTVLTENESSFGLLGWFSRFLNKYPSEPVVDPVIEENLLDEVSDALDDEVLDNVDDNLDEETDEEEQEPETEESDTEETEGTSQETTDPQE